MNKYNKNKKMTALASDYIKETLDKEPQIKLLIVSFAQSYKEQFKGVVSNDVMKEVYNMLLFLACNIIEVKNNDKTNK